MLKFTNGHLYFIPLFFLIKVITILSLVEVRDPQDFFALGYDAFLNI